MKATIGRCSMPYIKPDRRAVLDDWYHLDFPMDEITDSGELNYVLTRICHGYLNNVVLRYASLNDVIGALEGAKLELYRRVVAPYEDVKIELNGDVSPG